MVETAPQTPAETPAATPDGACDTLIWSERKHFKRKGGACATVFAQSVDDAKKLGAVRAGTIKVDGKWGLARKVAYNKAAH